MTGRQAKADKNTTAAANVENSQFFRADFLSDKTEKVTVGSV
jgi:hypothetical protein